MKFGAAFVAEYDALFRIVDISDPANPDTVDSYRYVHTGGQEFNYFWSVAVQDRYAYVTEIRTWQLLILDMSDFLPHSEITVSTDPANIKYDIYGFKYRQLRSDCFEYGSERGRFRF